ncbi:hypothetical protein KY359_02150 [Candidatus Woesearchaeota archaeon]|nr:hypothetical protein [Candidatus Woesearchaeota archaeon]
MYPELEDCGHVLEDLYDYALENRLPVVAVDNEITQAYWGHKRQYDALLRHDGFRYDLRLHRLNMHVLEDHVRSELEKMVVRQRRSQEER